MGHINSLREWQLQQLIPELYRPEDSMYCKPACIFSQVFKFEKLQLGCKRCVLHFKCPDDLLVGYELVDHAMHAKYHVSFGVACLELPASMLFVLQFQYVRTHPLRYDFRVRIGLEK